MFEFGESQKKRRHHKAQSYDLRSTAKTARHNALLAKRAERLAEKKRIKALTVTVRTAKGKQKKFKDLKREITTEARALLKTCQGTQEKLQKRFAALAVLTERFAAMSDSYWSNVSDGDIDITSSIDALESVIETVKETSS